MNATQPRYSLPGLKQQSRRGSSRAGLVLFLSPSIFLLILLVAALISNTVGGHRGISAYKLWAVGLSFLISLPLNYAMNRIARTSSSWHSKSAFFGTAILGGMLWAIALSFTVQATAILVVSIEAPGMIGGSLSKMALFAFRSALAPALIFCAFLVPIYLLYSLRCRKAHWS